MDEFDLDTDEELSELDEEQFKDLKDSQVEKADLTEYTMHDLPKFKRKSSSHEGSVKPKRNRLVRRRRRAHEALLDENKEESRSEMDPDKRMMNLQVKWCIIFFIVARWELDQALNEAIMSSRKKRRRGEDVYILNFLYFGLNRV